MYCRLAKLILIGSCLYAIAAVFSFHLVFSPFASTTRLPSAFLCSAIVGLPYLAVLLACHKAYDHISKITAITISVIVAGVGAYTYWYSFSDNDGEYLVVYYITPLIQGPFALTAVFMSIWRRKSARKPTTEGSPKRPQ